MKQLRDSHSGLLDRLGHLPMRESWAGCWEHNRGSTPARTEFTFAPAQAPEANGLLGVASAPPPAGFGCESVDVLHVQRRSDNEISFPGCTDFPYPLVRCGSR